MSNTRLPVPTLRTELRTQESPGRSSEVVIRVESLSKSYRIGESQTRRTLREAIMALPGAPWRRLRKLWTPASEIETFWALRDVSFEVRRGDVLGIIGRNGAGKSTLLKVLSRITEPTSGQATIHGRVGSLLEVGTGFHSELTGRENISLNGAILGMRRAEIQAKFDEIVAFAEIEKFIDTPVKHYSSGMYLRLAFAVAAHLEPEILLVDEVLAVGDAMFQKKCLGKMQDVARAGRTVLFVSHNMAAVRSMCNRGVLLDQGSLAFSGSVELAAYNYNQLLTANQAGPVRREVDFTNIRINGGPAGAIAPGEDFEVACRLHLKAAMQSFRIYCIIQDGNGDQVVVAGSDHKELKGCNAAGSHEIQLLCPGLWLRPGVYSLHFKLFANAISSNGGRYVSDTVMLDVAAVSATGPLLGYLAPTVRWRVET